MLGLYYLIFTLVVILLAILVFGVFYALYTRKINGVLKNQTKPGNYGSLDKRFFTIVISSILLLVGLFLVVYHMVEKRYTYTIPFYENIADFDIEKYERDVHNIMKPTDDYVVVNENLAILTDREGKILDVSMTLIVNKGGTYYFFSSGFDDENNTIIYNGGNATISSGILNAYVPLSHYKVVFSRIDFSNIWHITDIKDNNYFDLQFVLSLRNNTYDPAYYDIIKVINEEGHVEDYHTYISGLMGIFSINQKRNYLDGSATTHNLDYYLLIP